MKKINIQAVGAAIAVGTALAAGSAIVTMLILKYNRANHQ